MSSEAVAAAKKALAACKAANDAEGQVVALLRLAEARHESDDTDAALAAARRAVKMAKALENSGGQARGHLIIASAQLDKGYWELAIRATNEGLHPLEEANETASAEALRLETVRAQAHHARGEEPPTSAARSAALRVVGELGKALQEQNAERFQELGESLQGMGGYTETDTDRAFATAIERGGHDAETFLAQQDWVQSLATKLQEDEGTVCCLRTFPCRADLQESVVGKLAWTQSQGHIVLTYQLEGGPRHGVPGGWTREDIVVQLAKEQIQVMIGASAVKELSGQLHSAIWRKDSWWMVEEDALLVIKLYKRSFGAWETVFQGLRESPTERTPLPWNDSQRLARQEESHASQGANEAELSPVLAGKPDPEEDEPTPHGGYRRSTPGGAFAPPSSSYRCSASDLCLGITTSQSADHVDIDVHFERVTWMQLKASLPLEKVFAVDVWERHICIFIQGDKSNPIVWGELAGQVNPHRTSWCFSSSDAMRRRQETPELFSPCLSVRVVKAPGSRGEWPKVFNECVQTKLMTKDWERGCPTRFEGMAGVPTAHRAGYDLASSDFWSFVGDYCNETMKKTGHATAPKPMAVT